MKNYLKFASWSAALIVAGVFIAAKAPKAQAISPTEFRSTWKTDNPGTSASDQITIPTLGDGYDYNINWGDGSPADTGVTGNITHTYDTPGTYGVSITGTFPGMFFVLDGDRLKLLSIDQWGTDPHWSTMAGAFFGCDNMVINAIDAPDLSAAGDMTYAFRGTTFSSSLNNWDVSHVTNFTGMFQDSAFNGDISSWDVSGATEFGAMFYSDTAFNQDIGDWNMGSAASTSSMFYNNTSFNQDLSDWDVSSVSNMSYMFYNNTSFDQDVGAWDVSSVTDATDMFYGATLSTANYDSLLSGWTSLGLSLHTGVPFNAGNSTFCNIQSWVYLHEVPVMWNFTDGGIGNCSLVLTEVAPIPASVTAADAVYHFSVNQEIDDAFDFDLGEYQFDPLGCDHCTAVLDPTSHAVGFSGLVKGDHVDAMMRFVTDGGSSNDLEIGPFTIIGSSNGGSHGSGGGSLSCCNSLAAHRNGTLILDGQTVYLMKDGQRFGFRDPEEFQSYGYGFSQVVSANAADRQTAFLPDNILKAMAGTLALDKSDGKTVYMIGGNFTKRGFVSSEVFTGLGYSFAGLPKINLADYPAGPAISSAAEAHPAGSLVLDGKTVWWIIDGVRRGFESEAVFNTYGFSFSRAVKANASDLNFATGPLVKLRDGTLVSDAGSYYLISDGVKVPFGSESILTQQGYKTANAIRYALSGY
jgi:surface protein